MLGAAGFEWYEISNWARAGRACRHNECYWAQGEYLAIGCAAHGHTDGRRWWNVRAPERYIDRIARGESPEADFEVLDAPTRRDEAFALALRTRGGAVAPPGTEAEVAALVEAGLLDRDGARVMLDAHRAAPRQRPHRAVARGGAAGGWHSIALSANSSSEGPSRVGAA